MIENTILHGNNIKTLKSIPDGFVNCCVTSPPYYGLRDYGIDGQIGLEKTPEEYIQKLVQVFREVRRVLKDDGTLWVNIGDSYAGSGKGSATHPESVSKYKQGTNCGMIGKSAVKKVSWGECKPKDLMGIPWMLALALRDDGWYLRQDIIWHKPNPMPESVSDRCTKAHEYIFLLSKSARYYFNSEAISEPAAESTIARINQDVAEQRGSYRQPDKINGPMKAAAPRYGGKTDKSIGIYDYSLRRNKRSVWTVNTASFRDAHFAVFPEKLILPCILAGCKKGGVVLDPFMGSGTTAVVAVKNLRKYIACEINPEYIKIAEKRIASEKGLFDNIQEQETI